MKNKYSLHFIILTSIFISACSTSTSSSSQPSSELVIPPIPTFTHPENQIEISRASWPLLAHDPNEPTSVYFNNVEFKYFAANNETNNIITGKGIDFFIYNQEAIPNITKIELHLARSKAGSNPESFSFFVSSSRVNPLSSSEKKVPDKISPLLYELDLTGLDVSYFSLTNQIYKIEISKIVISLENDDQLPQERVLPTFENDPTSEGFYQLLEPSITRADFRNVVGSPLDGASFPNVGSPKLLVVPINFRDFGCVGQTACQQREEEIRKAFFGETEETGYESVRSYYYTSSYGKLDIQGVVTPTYEVNMTADAWARQTQKEPTWSLGNDVVNWYKDLTRSTLSDFDANEDGWIDSLVMIYNAPSYPNGGYREDVRNTFWAYCWWNWDNLNLGTPQNPVPFTFFFASFDFMYEGIYLNESGDERLVDPHTFIHEFGHLLGLQDYYTYDSLDGDWGAAGKLDMMDNNILDHNAYSKFLLEWINPYVIDNKQESVTIKIEPFEKSGDAIIINNNFNGSPYDEYLILEYYTPTGLNEQHSVVPYPGNNLSGFSESGIKIYHVDSRIGEYRASDGNFVGYLDSIDRLQGSTSAYSLIVNSNSVSRHFGSKTHQKLLHLLESNGRNSFREGFGATNETLFQEGDWFDAYKHYSNLTTFGKFNDFSEIGFRIIVNDINPNEATLTIERFYF